MSRDGVSAFRDENYLSLESFRKNGEGIKTPLWFVESDGTIFVYSLSDAPKVRRVRNNPRVRVAPCDVRGGLKGDWHEGTATILDDTAAAHAHVLLTKKYGILKRIGDIFSKLRKRSRTAIAIKLDKP